MVKKSNKKKFEVDWEKATFYGIILGWCAAELYLLLIIATALTA